MAYSLADNSAGLQQLTEASDTQRHPFGTIARGWDPVYGFGEFTYLKGASSNFAGAIGTYITNTGAFSLSTTSGVLAGGAPVAVSLSAATASQFGWFQIAGDAILYKTAVAVEPHLGTKVYLSGTAGRVMPTSVAGRQVLGARFANAATIASGTSTIIVTINRPSLKSGSAV